MANQYIVEKHRHHTQVQGHKFSIGLFNGENLIGVAVCGRPVSRHLDDGLNLEITRLCVDEAYKNSCSKLYSVCARIAKEMGYKRILTYILKSETGISLRASGWVLTEDNCGGTVWKRNDGERTDTISNLFGEKKKYPKELKQRWERIYE